MQLTAYLSFNGQCEAAFKFYEQCLGGRIVAMHSYKGTPAAEQIPPEAQDRIMHARLEVGSAVLMGGDAPPQYYSEPQGFSVSINLEDPAEAERIFQALSEGGSVRMPIQETFWARRFGMLVDRFGTPWMVNCEKAG